MQGAATNQYAVIISDNNKNNNNNATNQYSVIIPNSNQFLERHERDRRWSLQHIQRLVALHIVVEHHFGLKVATVDFHLQC